MRSANRFYAPNIERFSQKSGVDTYRESTPQRYVEENEIVSRLISGRGKPSVVRDTRDLMGPNSLEWAAIAIEQTLDAGRNQTWAIRRVVNADSLGARLNSLDDETIRELFGVGDAQQLRNLAVDVSNRAKYLDAEALSPNGNGNILQQLRAAVAADDRIARDFRENAIAPFRGGED